jgi:sec-independent protein translocase protein TatA
MEGLLSPVHLLILGVIALVIFGPKRLPELGRSLGASMREFKTGLSGLNEQMSSSPNTSATPPALEAAPVAPAAPARAQTAQTDARTAAVTVETGPTVAQTVADSPAPASNTVATSAAVPVAEVPADSGAEATSH